MTYTDKTFCLDVRGDYACFTRPEMKVERVSYDVITPSAARAIFTAIFWKPAVRWHVRRIEVLSPIRWTSVRRNEVGKIASANASGIIIEDDRQQRAGLFLRDVHYRLHATLEFIPPPRRPRTLRPVSDALLAPEEREAWAKDENPGKYNAMFERRAKKGQCFNQPYLGCREFSCSFRLVEAIESEPPPIPETRDLGFMLYDLDFTDPNDPKPAFYRPRLEQGIIEVPPWNSEEVRK
jgi:CRISPR-associated protein Cas5d